MTTCTQPCILVVAGEGQVQGADVGDSADPAGGAALVGQAGAEDAGQAEDAKHQGEVEEEN